MTQDVGSDPTVGVPGFCVVCALPIRCSFCEEMMDKGCMWVADAGEDEENEGLYGSGKSRKSL